MDRCPVTPGSLFRRIGTMISPLFGLIRGLRPRQWLKNVLVATGPLAAGVLLDPDVWPLVLLAFALFCAAASGVYLVNDALDRKEDRLHPRKRFRPIASGALPLPLAVVVAVILLVGAPVVASLVSWPLAAVLGIYEIVQISYCFWLKHIVVIDLVVVSSGFVLRAIAGAVVADVVLSQWFLLVMSFGSLFMVAGKRFSEKLQVDQSSGPTRRTLDEYTPGYLRFVWSIAACVALVAYSLWAFELGAEADFPWAAISIVPFGTALLRYGFIVDGGHAGAPEETVLRDRSLAALAFVWIVVFVVVVLTR